MNTRFFVRLLSALQSMRSFEVDLAARNWNPCRAQRSHRANRRGPSRVAMQNATRKCVDAARPRCGPVRDEPKARSSFHRAPRRVLSPRLVAGCITGSRRAHRGAPRRLVLGTRWRQAIAGRRPSLPRAVDVKRRSQGSARRCWRTAPCGSCARRHCAVSGDLCELRRVARLSPARAVQACEPAGLRLPTLRPVRASSASRWATASPLSWSKKCMPRGSTDMRKG
jgi:hypothetical protein